MNYLLIFDAQMRWTSRCGSDDRGAIGSVDGSASDTARLRVKTTAPIPLSSYLIDELMFDRCDFPFPVSGYQSANNGWKSPRSLEAAKRPTPTYYLIYALSSDPYS